MNIAFATNVVYPYITGGAQKRIYEIGQRLEAEGHAVTIYSRYFWEGPKEIDLEGMTLRAVSPECKLYTDEDGRRSITEALEFSKDLFAPLRRNIDDHDLVVATVFPYFPVLATKLATVGTGTPLVTTWHEVWGDYWDDYLGYLAPFGKLTEHLTARTPQHPLTVSGITADRLAAIGPNRAKIEIVPNGIATEQIRNAPLPEQGYDILFAGRLIEDKNVDILLNAFDAAANDHHATLGIIGDGPERDRLKAKHETLSHADKVEFLGFFDNYEDVLGHMRAAEIFASPSTREGFGITYAEAIAADCTVIGADHPDSAADEVIGDAGFLVEPTVDALSATLRSALAGHRPPTDPVERSRRYDWDTVAKQAESAYRAAINATW